MLGQQHRERPEPKPEPCVHREGNQRRNQRTTESEGRPARQRRQRVVMYESSRPLRRQTFIKQTQHEGERDTVSRRQTKDELQKRVQETEDAVETEASSQVQKEAVKARQAESRRGMVLPGELNTGTVERNAYGGSSVEPGSAGRVPAAPVRVNRFAKRDSTYAAKPW